MSRRQGRSATAKEKAPTIWRGPFCMRGVGKTGRRGRRPLRGDGEICGGRIATPACGLVRNDREQGLPCVGGAVSHRLTEGARITDNPSGAARHLPLHRGGLGVAGRCGHRPLRGVAEPGGRADRVVRPYEVTQKMRRMTAGHMGPAPKKT